VLIVVAVLAALRLSIAVGLPLLLDRWARGHGLACSYERLDLSLLRGRVELWHLTLKPRVADAVKPSAARSEASSPVATAEVKPAVATTDVEPLLHLEYATLDVDVRALFAFRFVLDRVEIDGVDLHVARDADGRWNFGELLAPSTEPIASGSSADATASPVTTAEHANTSDAAKPIHLAPPIAIAALRAQSIHVHCEDACANPPIDARADIDFSASDVGSKTRPARFELALVSRDGLGNALVTGRLAGDDRSLRSNVRVDAFARNPQALRGWLAALGVAPVAREISFALNAEVEAAVQGEHQDEARAKIAVHDVRLLADLDEAFAIDALTCDVESISMHGAHVSEVVLSGVRGAAQKLASGALRVAGVELATANASSAAPRAADASAPDLGAPRVRIDRAVLEKSALRLRDESVEPAAALSLELERVEIDHVDSGAHDAGPPITLHAVVHAPGISEIVKLDGEAELFARRKRVEIELSAEHITLKALAPHLRALGLESDFTSGSLSFKIAGTADTDEHGVSRGELSVEHFRLRDTNELFDIDRMQIADATIDPAHHLVRFGRVEIGGAEGDIERSEDFAVHAFGLRVLPLPKSSAAPASTETTATKPASTTTASGESASTKPAATKPASTTAASTTASSATPANTTTRSTASASNTPRATGATVDDASAEPSARFEIASFAWNGSTLRFRDAALEPPLALTLADIALDVRDLSIGGAAGDPPRAPAEVRLSMRAPGMAEKLALDATIASRPGPIDLALTLHMTGAGLRAGELTPYLAASGIESKLEGAAISATIEASVKEESGGVAANLALKHAELSNGGERLLSLDEIALRDVHVRGDEVRIGEAVIVNPHAAIARDSSGALIAGGLRFTKREAATVARELPPPLLEPLVRPLIDEAMRAFADKDFAIQRARLDGAELAWNDAAAKTPVGVRARASASLDGFVMGRAAPPAHFAWSTSVSGVVEKLDVTGTLSLAPGDWSADVRVDSSGLEGEVLAAYLPPNTEAELRGGSLRLHLGATLETNREGGDRAEITLDDLVYETGDPSDAPFKLGALVVRVPRADFEKNVVAIGEVSLRGVECGARRDAQGKLHALGFVLGTGASNLSSASVEVSSNDAMNASSATAAANANAATKSSPSANTEASSATKASSSVVTGAPTLDARSSSVSAAKPNPVSGGTASTAASSPPNTVSVASSAAPATPSTTRVRSARARSEMLALPTVSLAKLDVGVDKLTFVDETRGAGAVPLVGSLRISTDREIVLLDSNPSALPPMHAAVHATLAPIVGSVDVAIEAQPYAEDPVISLTFAARGVRGEGLTEFAPELAGRIDGSGFCDGAIDARARLELSMDRRAPASFDFGRNFGASFELVDFAVRDRPDGNVLAGLGALRIEAERIARATGDVHVTSIDVIKPRAVVHKKADGLHVLGLVVKPEVAAAPALNESAAPSSGGPSSDGDAPSASSPAIDATSSTPSAGVRRGARAEPELRIDQISISGIDLDLRDDSVEPPFVLPIADLEIDVSHLGSRSFKEPIPVFFAAFINAGDVELPRRRRSGKPVGDVIENVPGLSTVAGFVHERDVALEPRPAFEELSGRGVITFAPRFAGNVVVDVRSLELLNFAGLARKGDVKVNDGVLDSRVKLEVRREGGASVDARFRFSDLSLSEPIGGPIQRYLLLPAPLDQVLFVLRDSNGDQVIPLDFEVEAADVSGGQITKAAIVAFSGVVAKAIASAPLRILSWVGSWFGIGTGEREKLEKEARSVRFDPGDASMTTATARELEPLVELLRDDADTMLVVRQELGEGDVERARTLANPASEECLAIVARLRQERSELEHLGDEAQSRARAQWSVGRGTEANAASDELRAITTRLGETDSALDRMLDIVRPGAERYRDRRTHAACRLIAAQRITSLRELFARAGVKDVEARLEVRALRQDPTAGDGGGRVTLTPRLRTAP
jgi:hypothetical protein